MKSSRSSTLTEEQRKRIEENRLKALQRRKESVLKNSNHTAACTSIISGNSALNLNGLATSGLHSTGQTNSTKDQSAYFAGLFKSSGGSTTKQWMHATGGSNTTMKSNDNQTNKTTESTTACSHGNLSSSGFNNLGIKNTTCYFSLIARKRFQVQMGFYAPAIAVFKTIPSRSYNMTTKVWNFGIEDHNQLVAKLRSLIPSIAVSPLPSNILSIFLKASSEKNIKEVDLLQLSKKLRDSLLPFQVEGVCFSLNRNGRVLLADDMGLGKTIQAIAIAAYYKKEWPFLVVCPASLRYSWREAIFTWMPDLNISLVNIINTNKDSVDWGEVVILSYDMMSRRKQELEGKKFKVIILDESHFLKSFKSARTKVIQGTLKTTKHVILLSGTPALSRPIELYTQISMIKPNLFPRVTEFGIRYCNGRQMPWGWDYTGSSNMTELNLLLEETIMIRRLKSEVMTQLPSKVRQVIMLDPATIKRDSEVCNAFSKELERKEIKGMEKRGVLLQFYNRTASDKANAVCLYLTDLLEADHKFICFAHHRVMLDAIEELLIKKQFGYMRIDGSTPSEKRNANCEKFQLADSCRVALLSITAVNAGVNLTAANQVVFAELFWNPGILTQAEDRAHRIGQQDSVVVQYLVAEGTADDYLWPMIQQKLDVLSKAGLSKDNFRDSDTISIRKDVKHITQMTLEEFFVDFKEVEDLEKACSQNFNISDLKSDEWEPPNKKLYI